MNGISSMNLAESLVASVIEAHLNAELLKRPHRVRGLDFCDGFFTVELEAQEPAAATAEPIAFVPVPMPALSNKAVREALQPEPENGKRKMLTDAQKQAIYEAVKADRTRPASSIAAEVGAPVTTVAGYVTQYRKGIAEAIGGNGNGNNRLEAVHSAEPVQAPF